MRDFIEKRLLEIFDKPGGGLQGSLVTRPTTRDWKNVPKDMRGLKPATLALTGYFCTFDTKWLTEMTDEELLHVFERVVRLNYKQWA